MFSCFLCELRRTDKDQAVVKRYLTTPIAPRVTRSASCEPVVSFFRIRVISIFTVTPVTVLLLLAFGES